MDVRGGEKMMKYPRTPHLPFSEGMTRDDRVWKDTHYFDQTEVVVTEKMDGGKLTQHQLRKEEKNGDV